MPRTTGEALRADGSELGSGFQFLLAVPGTHFYFLSASVYNHRMRTTGICLEGGDKMNEAVCGQHRGDLSPAGL